jgi:hypothetical protein
MASENEKEILNERHCRPPLRYLKQEGKGGCAGRTRRYGDAPHPGMQRDLVDLPWQSHP